MALSTKELRQRISGVSNIQKITRAMEMVATTKLRRLQDRAEGTRPYADTIVELSAQLAAAILDERSPLTRKIEDVKRAAVFVVSADRGLCGSYNANLIKKVFAQVDELKGKEIDLYLLGRKAVQALRRRLPVRKTIDGTMEQMGYHNAKDIARMLTEAFLSEVPAEQAHEVWIVYTRFVSVARQVPTVEKLLPIENAEVVDEKAADALPNMILEPSAKALLERLLPKSLEVRIFAAILDSLASEFAARRIAMKAATDAAGDMIQALRRKYNRARQESITTELLDIVGGAEALK